MTKKRDIYIRVENMAEIVALLEEIKRKEEITKALFYEYDKLNMEENRVFENWNNYLDEIFQRMDNLGV